MAHWFDNLTKNLAAPDDAPRRSFFRQLGAAMGAGVVASIPASRALGAAVARQNVALANGGKLVAPGSSGSGVIIRNLSFNQDGLTLSKQLSFDQSTKTGTEVTTVSKGAATVFKMTVAVTKTRATTINATYGAEVQGAKSVTMTSKDGLSFHGSIDGRAFMSLKATPEMSQVHFTDGHPAPKITISDASINAAINRLGAASNKQLIPVPASRAGSNRLIAQTAPVKHTSGPKFHKTPISAPGENWYEPSNDVVDCTSCETGCNNTYADMMPGIATIIFCPPCAAADVAAALLYWAGCMIACNLPGGGCLPTPCGFFTTCGKNDKCFTFQGNAGSKGGSLCCPAPAAVCNNVCCGTDVTSCSPDGTCGCSSGQSACGNDCCDAGEVCTNGICCQPGQTNCNGTCCASGNVCHNGACCAPQNICGTTCCDPLSNCADPKKGLCCSFTSIVCNGLCCPYGSQCINGKCCAQESACGSVCCASGQICLDAKTGKCATSACPKGQAPCMPDSGKGLCCATGVACCPGTCCKPGQVCNYEGPPDGSGTYTCGPMPVIQ